jgi:hypothetical protein
MPSGWTADRARATASGSLLNQNPSFKKARASDPGILKSTAILDGSLEAIETIMGRHLRRRILWDVAVQAGAACSFIPASSPASASWPMRRISTDGSQALYTWTLKIGNS